MAFRAHHPNYHKNSTIMETLNRIFQNTQKQSQTHSKRIKTAQNEPKRPQTDKNKNHKTSPKTQQFHYPRNNKTADRTPFNQRSQGDIFAYSSADRYVWWQGPTFSTQSGATGGPTTKNSDLPSFSTHNKQFTHQKSKQKYQKNHIPKSINNHISNLKKP